MGYRFAIPNYSEDQLMHFVCDSVVPGICQDCGEESDVEPDAYSNWCPCCGGKSVVSVLVMLGVM